MPVAVAAAESGVVAVGPRAFRDADTPAGGTAGAWRSDDGHTWEPANWDGLAVGDALPMSGPEAGLVDVAWGPGGFVAVGHAYAGSADRSTVVGGAWHSADGRSWSRSTAPVWALARPAAVTWSGTRYVVVGVVEEDAAPRAAAWFSFDGLEWARAPDAPVFDVGTYMDTMEYHAWGGPQDVASTEDGALLAIGRTCREGAPGAAVCQELVWRSEDAMAWEREELGAAGADTALRSIAAVGDHVVAVGGTSFESGAAGTDPARVAVHVAGGWQRVEPPGIPRMAHVIPFGTGFVAAAGTGLWVSISGEVWTPVTGSPSFDAPAFDIGRFGAQLVGVGWTENAGGFSVLWTPGTT